MGLLQESRLLTQEQILRGTAVRLQRSANPEAHAVSSDCLEDNSRPETCPHTLRTSRSSQHVSKKGLLGFRNEDSKIRWLGRN